MNTETDMKLLRHAILNDDLQKVQTLIRGYDPAWLDELGQSPMHFAVQNLMRIAKVHGYHDLSSNYIPLTKQGLNRIKTSGVTVDVDLGKHMYIRPDYAQNALKIVETLIVYCAKLNVRNIWGKTPGDLLVTEQFSASSVIRKELRHLGVSIFPDEVQTPLRECMRMLHEHGGCCLQWGARELLEHDTEFDMLFAKIRSLPKAIMSWESYDTRQNVIDATQNLIIKTQESKSLRNGEIVFLDGFLRVNRELGSMYESMLKTTLENFMQDIQQKDIAILARLNAMAIEAHLNGNYRLLELRFFREFFKDMIGNDMWYVRDIASNMTILVLTPHQFDILTEHDSNRMSVFIKLLGQASKLMLLERYKPETKHIFTELFIRSMPGSIAHDLCELLEQEFAQDEILHRVVAREVPESKLRNLHKLLDQGTANHEAINKELKKILVEHEIKVILQDAIRDTPILGYAQRPILGHAQSQTYQHEQSTDGITLADFEKLLHSNLDDELWSNASELQGELPYVEIYLC